MGIIFKIHNINDYLDMTLSMIYVMNYVFSFDFFVQSISSFAADLTGGASVGGVTMSPTSLVDKVRNLASAAASMASAAAKAKTGDKQGAMQDSKGAKDKATGGGATKNRGGGSDSVSTGGSSSPTGGGD